MDPGLRRDDSRGMLEASDSNLALGKSLRWRALIARGHESDGRMEGEVS